MLPILNVIVAFKLLKETVVQKNHTDVITDQVPKNNFGYNYRFDQQRLEFDPVTIKLKKRRKNLLEQHTYHTARVTEDPV